MKILFSLQIHFICFSLMSIIAWNNANGQSINVKKQVVSIEVKNQLNFARTEVVSIKGSLLNHLLKLAPAKNLRIRLKGTANNTVTQWVDVDSDGNYDELLFMSTVAASSSSFYNIVVDSTSTVPKSQLTTFSRFVPERTDDYAWENDRVAFRTYGPDAQMRIEKKMPNGTLSSGIDLWLKRTTEPIINEWYKGYLTDSKFYHIDHGKGYDPYHVGASRGTGGTGVWDKDSLYVSKNFTKYKTITTGPLRTVFQLEYAEYSRYQIREIKRISLDLGSNFSKIEVKYTANAKLPNYVVGITLHDKKGEVDLNQKDGVFIHNEKIDNTFLGEALVLNPKLVKDAYAYQSSKKDHSNLMVLTTPENPLTYYAGFAWELAKYATNATEWKQIASKQAQILANPLTVAIQ